MHSLTWIFLLVTIIPSIPLGEEEHIQIFSERHLYGQSVFKSFEERTLFKVSDIAQSFACFFLFTPYLLIIASRYWQEQIPSAIFCRTLSKYFILGTPFSLTHQLPTSVKIKHETP